MPSKIIKYGEILNFDYIYASYFEISMTIMLPICLYNNYRFRPNDSFYQCLWANLDFQLFSNTKNSVPLISPQCRNQNKTNFYDFHHSIRTCLTKSVLHREKIIYIVVWSLLSSSLISPTTTQGLGLNVTLCSTSRARFCCVLISSGRTCKFV